jgi:hypothetical protein
MPFMAEAGERFAVSMDSQNLPYALTIFGDAD